MRSLSFSISGGFYAEIRSISCALPVLLEERDICLGTGVRRKMLASGINRKMPKEQQKKKKSLHRDTLKLLKVKHKHQIKKKKKERNE